MGIAKKVAKAAGRKAVEGAKNKARKANKHYCPESSNGKHHYIHHADSEHKGDGPPTVHYYCKWCGFTRP